MNDKIRMSNLNNSLLELPDESSLMEIIPELTKNFFCEPSPSNTVSTPGFMTANVGT